MPSWTQKLYKSTESGVNGLDLKNGYQYVIPSKDDLLELSEAHSPAVVKTIFEQIKSKAILGDISFDTKVQLKDVELLKETLQKSGVYYNMTCTETGHTNQVQLFVCWDINSLILSHSRRLDTYISPHGLEFKGFLVTPALSEKLTGMLYSKQHKNGTIHITDVVERIYTDTPYMVTAETESSFYKVFILHG